MTPLSDKIDELSRLLKNLRQIADRPKWTFVFSLKSDAHERAATYGVLRGSISKIVLHRTWKEQE